MALPVTTTLDVVSWGLPAQGINTAVSTETLDVVSWGLPNLWIFMPAGGTAYNQNVSGAASPAGAIVKQTNKRVGAI